MTMTSAAIVAIPSSPEAPQLSELWHEAKHLQSRLSNGNEWSGVDEIAFNDGVGRCTKMIDAVFAGKIRTRADLIAKVEAMQSEYAEGCDLGNCGPEAFATLVDGIKRLAR